MREEGRNYGQENVMEQNMSGAARLMRLMTGLPDELLEEAISYQKPAVKNISWNKGAWVAACLGLLLIGGLAWDAWQDPLGEMEPTMAGVSTGAAGGQTLAPGTGQTADPTGAGDAVVSGFCYDGQWYVSSGWILTELPGNCVYQGTLYTKEDIVETQMEDWVTRDPAMAGAKVYRMVGDYTGFFVETETGYEYYGMASLWREQSGETEGHS